MLKQKVKPNIDPNVMYYISLLKKEGYDFNIDKDISDKIVDLPQLKTDNYCAICGDAMFEYESIPGSSRKVSVPKNCKCGENSDMPVKSVPSKALKELNKYLELRHHAKILQAKKELKGSTPTAWQEYKITDIIRCRKVRGNNLGHLKGKEMIGIVFNNGIKVRYLFNGKMG